MSHTIGVYLCFLLIYASSCLGYRLLFLPDTARPNYAKIGRTLFSRIYLPDSGLYDALYSGTGITFSELLADLQADDTAGQNILAISALTAAYRDAGIDPLLLNGTLVAMAGLLVLSICTFHRVSPIAPLSLLFLNPSTIFYSQTSTKEVLTLFANMLLLSVLARPGVARRFALGLPAVALGFLFRMQTAIPMFIALFLSLFPSRLQRRAFLFVFLALTMLLPLLYQSGSIRADAADQFRLDAPSITGIARYVDTGLRYIPLAGLLLLPVRMFQNATEPFPALLFTEVENGTTFFMVYPLVGALTVALTWFFAFEVSRLLWRLVAHDEYLPRHLVSVVLFAGLFWLMVASNPFVHSRYLYSVQPTLAVAAVLNRQYRESFPGSGAPLTSTPHPWSTAPSWTAWVVLLVLSFVILIFR